MDQVEGNERRARHLKEHAMQIELTASEADVLAELLEATHRDKLHGLHHTTTRAYAAMLRSRIELIESVRHKIEAGRSATATEAQTAQR